MVEQPPTRGAGSGVDLLAVRIRLFDTPTRELARAVHGPWPQWMERLYELDATAERTPSPGAGEASIGSAVHALEERLRHRLSTASFAISAMEELGWSASLEGEDIVLTYRTSRHLAVTMLEEAGVYGALTKVCELDDRGLPLLGTVAEER